jgi:peptidoglycan/xylan/chitin deacetylase (PgdA/CDA1 family)
MWAQRHTTIILTYHRVIEKWDQNLDYSQPGMAVTAPTFDRQLSFLKEQFDIVPLDGLRADGNIDWPASRSRCVITFDDGWRDNYDLAFPILRKHDIPATIFLTTDFIGTDRAFWHTELIYLLLRGELPQLLGSEIMFRACPGPVRHHLKRLARMGRVSSAHDVDPVIEAVKAMCDEDAIEELIQRLIQAVGLRRPLFPERKFFLDWDQVREMSASGIEIGSHGCSHRILTRLSAEEAEEELVRSKAEIERRLGRRVQHFAFPNEAANGALLTSAATAGYRTACLGPGAGEGPFGIQALRRLGMHEEVCGGGPPFDEALLRFWLFRAPKGRPV